MTTISYICYVNLVYRVLCSGRLHVYIRQRKTIADRFIDSNFARDWTNCYRIGIINTAIPAHQHKPYKSNWLRCLFITHIINGMLAFVPRWLCDKNDQRQVICVAENTFNEHLCVCMLKLWLNNVNWTQKKRPKFEMAETIQFFDEPKKKRLPSQR